VTTIPDNQAGPRRRRPHSDEFKARAVASCMQPGMSMAAVAMAHGVNANLLRRWVREAEMKPRLHGLPHLRVQGVQLLRTDHGQPSCRSVALSTSARPAIARARALLFRSCG
jgi:transposase-like protein